MDFLAKFEPKLQMSVFFGAFRVPSCVFVQVLKDVGVSSKLINFLCILLKFWCTNWALVEVFVEFFLRFVLILDKKILPYLGDAT